MPWKPNGTLLKSMIAVLSLIVVSLSTVVYVGSALNDQYVTRREYDLTLKRLEGDLGEIKGMLKDHMEIHDARARAAPE
jgi:hypothetical protein